MHDREVFGMSLCEREHLYYCAYLYVCVCVSASMSMSEELCILFSILLSHLPQMLASPCQSNTGKLFNLNFYGFFFKISETSVFIP